MANPVGVLHFDVFSSSGILYWPSWASGSLSGYYATGRKVGSTAYGGGSPYPNTTDANFTVTRSGTTIGGSVWITGGFQFNNVVAISLAVGNTPIPLFKFGDVSVWLNSTTQIQIKNVNTVIATLTHPGLVINVWYDFLIYVQLNASTGAASVTWDGITANSATNLNTVGTTPLASATTLVFNTSCYRFYNQPSYHLVDDVFFFNAAPPVDASGNQIYPKATRDYPNTDYALSGFAATPSGTVSAALQTIGDSKLAQGSNAGSTAALGTTNFANIPADGNTLLGVNVIVQGAKKLDSTARKLAAGLTLSGTDDLSPATALSTSTAAVIDFTVANTYSDNDYNAGNIKLKLAVS